MVEISIKKAVQVNSLITYENLWSGGDIDFWTGFRTRVPGPGTVT